MLLDLNMEILQIIFDDLDNYSLAAVAQVSSQLNALVRRTISFEQPAYWKTHDDQLPSNGISPPEAAYQHLQSMARIGHTVWLPYLSTPPKLYAFDIKTHTWCCFPVQLAAKDKGNYTPFFAPVVAIGCLLYMFGGQQVIDAQLLDVVHVLDTRTHTLARVDTVPGTNPHPKARVFHSLNVWDDRYIVVFGGLCSDSSGENDLVIFDTETFLWQAPDIQGHIPFVRYGHSSTIVSNRLYIFGGQSEQTVYDVLYSLDCKSWTWFRHDRPEAARYRRHLPRQELQASLYKDFVIETTGQPPSDRFHCSMCTVDMKIVIFGGLTQRQNDRNRNVIHAYTMKHIDVFDIHRQHWTTIRCGGGDVCLYDISCFAMDRTVYVFGCSRAAIADNDQGDEGASLEDDDSSMHCAVFGAFSHSPTSTSIHPYVFGVTNSDSSFSNSSSEMTDNKHCQHVTEPLYMTLTLQHE